jgi:hypothetical protein
MPIVKRGEKYFIKKKVANSEAMQSGIECETSEHPTMSPDQIKILVKDHLKEDPKYYDEYMDEESPEESVEEETDEKEK